MALRKVLADRYTWTEVVAGVARYYSAEKGTHYDFGASEITRGEALGALGAAAGGAVSAVLYGQVVAPAPVDTATLTARVITAEGRLDAAEGRLDTVEDDVADHEARLDVLEA